VQQAFFSELRFLLDALTNELVNGTLELLEHLQAGPIAWRHQLSEIASRNAILRVNPPEPTDKVRLFSRGADDTHKFGNPLHCIVYGALPVVETSSTFSIPPKP